MKDMADTEIEAVIVRELKIITNGTAQVSYDTNIARDLGLDSMAVMDLTMALEDHFDVSLPFDEIAQTETVLQLSELIRSHQIEIAA